MCWNYRNQLTINTYHTYIDILLYNSVISHCTKYIICIYFWEHIWKECVSTIELATGASRELWSVAVVPISQDEWRHIEGSASCSAVLSEEIRGITWAKHRWSKNPWYFMIKMLNADFFKMKISVIICILETLKYLQYVWWLSGHPSHEVLSFLADMF